MVLGIGLAGLLTGPLAAEDAWHEKFGMMARVIVAGLDQAQNAKKTKGDPEGLAAWAEKAYAYVMPTKLRVAVAPFDQEKIRLSKEVADEFNDALYAALLEQAGARYQLVARKKLTAIITDLQETGAWETSNRNPINALMVNAQNIDVLIVGRIRISGQTAFLRYAALGMGGAVTFAQTKRYEFKLNPDDAKITRPTVSLDWAIRNAAESLSGQVHDLEELLLGGIRFEDSGTQPAFGRYLQGLLSSAVRKAFSNPAVAKQIKVNALDSYRGYDRGIDIKAKQLVADTPAHRDKSYVLRGEYWELPGSIELRVSLKGAKGVAASWVGHIRLEDTAGRTLRPKGEFGTLRDNDGFGPFAFHLTSNRGDDAAYRIGEKMHLNIRLDRDAWTYCFYKQSDGKVIQILPNPHFWKRFKEPRLKGNVLHTIPGEKLFPFELKFSLPVGTELVKCFAVTRDVTNDLPPDLRGRSLDPLPQDLASTLPSVFQRLPSAAVSEASFVVTVDR